MFKLSEVHPYLLFLFNIVVILAVSWFASWTYLYSFSGLWRYLSAADFRNVLCLSMLISTLIIIDGAAILERSGFSRKGYEHTALAEKGMPSTNARARAQLSLFFCAQLKRYQIPWGAFSATTKSQIISSQLHDSHVSLRV